MMAGREDVGRFTREAARVQRDVGPAVRTTSTGSVAAGHDVPPAVADRRAVTLFGMVIDQLTMAETIARVDDLIASGGVHQHVAVNVDKVVKADRFPEVRAIVNGCDIASADGQPIVWASRVLGHRLPERVTGIDLMIGLIERAADAGYRLAFLGARPEIVDRVVSRVRREHPSVLIAAARDGYWQPDEEADIVRAIAASRPDILFLAIPSPAKERFLARWKADLGSRFVMGVGGSFDVYAGAIPRAPRVLQRLGLEWVHRLAREPRRMWRRYLVEDLAYAPIVVREWVRLRRSAAGDPHAGRT